MNSALELKDITVRFNKFVVGDLTLKNKITRLLTGVQPETFTALNKVCLRVNKSERLGIIGRNGSGKSTLLRVIAGIIVPITGSVDVYERVTPLLELGIGFHPELSGRENCYLAGALLGIPPKELSEKMDSIVEFSGLGRFIDQAVKTYSSGMFVRLAFTLATETEPEVLLVDEVLGVGDEFFQRKCILRLQQMMDKGMATIIVSHNLDFLVTQCNRLIWIENGEIVLDGAPQEVADRYRLAKSY